MILSWGHVETESKRGVYFRVQITTLLRRWLPLLWERMKSYKGFSRHWCRPISTVRVSMPELTYSTAQVSIFINYNHSRPWACILMQNLETRADCWDPCHTVSNISTLSRSFMSDSVQLVYPLAVIKESGVLVSVITPELASHERILSFNNNFHHHLYQV